VLIGRANAARDKAPHITELLEHQHVVELLLRLAHDKRFISAKQWAASVELSNRVGKQAGGWLKHSRTAPVA
ncbi:MAG: four helix bundle protein, partial [Variovorax sp.]